MENLILFDDEAREALLPLTYTRPVGELRVGILRIREKWETQLNLKASYITQDYLSAKFPLHIASDNYLINGSVLPSERLVHLVKQLEENEALLDQGVLVAARLGRTQFEHLMNNEEIDELAGFDVQDTPFNQVRHLWDIFRLNGAAIEEDFQLLTDGRKSEPLSFTNRLLGEDNIFVEPGARIECATINAETGPVYIGRDAEIMEGAVIRGPFALCDHAKVKMGAKIYGPSTIGPYSKVGGEINNSVITGYSNKAHDGFLGNSVLGEWCNIGADSNNSNLKNNYAEVRLWDYQTERFKGTDLQFCGLIMGDHSKCGINTMFNTGTVIGVSANIFGSGFPRNFVPSFSWGGHAGFSTYKLEKALDVAERVMERRDLPLTETDRGIMGHIFTQSAKYRRWETS